MVFEISGLVLEYVKIIACALERKKTLVVHLCIRIKLRSASGLLLSPKKSFSGKSKNFTRASKSGNCAEEFNISARTVRFSRCKILRGRLVQKVLTNQN